MVIPKKDQYLHRQEERSRKRMEGNYLSLTLLRLERLEWVLPMFDFRWSNADLNSG